MNFSVSELTNHLKTYISESLSYFTVTGEVYDFKPSNNHLYFCLKDNKSIIKVIVWNSNQSIDKNTIRNGLVIEAYGCLNYYDKSSSVSFIINRFVIINQEGVLITKLNQWKTTYEKMGYFHLKKEIPFFISDMVVVTSKEGAAIKDFLYVLNKNNYIGKIEILDSVVQGDRCVKSVCDALQSATFMKPQLVVITRGGGSLEDLISFSEPAILEAIFKLKQENICTISAIGHEVDNMLCDFVADIRTPTPSLAAEYIVSHNKKSMDEIISLFNKCIAYEKKQLIETLEQIKPTKHFNEIIDQVRRFISIEKKELNYLNSMLNEVKQTEIKNIINEFLNFIIIEKNKTNNNNVQLLNANYEPLDLSSIRLKKNIDAFIMQNNITYKISLKINGRVSSLE